MEKKIRAAAAARENKDTFLIARTDARAGHGLDEALRRAERYLRAGADVLFIESPESVEEMRRIGETFRGVPLLANMVQGGRTPVLDAATLQELGYRIAIHPGLAFLAMGAAIEAALADLKAGRTVSVPLYDFKAFSELMGFDWVSEFDRRYR
jgi:2-methylisocitrate lyase-like PEP mutase family enzyme